MMNPSEIKIMVGGKVVGRAERAIVTLADDTESLTKKMSDPWRVPGFEQKFEIAGNAIVRNIGDSNMQSLRDMSDGKFDVVIRQQIGHLPRKMKKAKKTFYRPMTKWKRKLAAYINRRSIKIRNAEMVITSKQKDAIRAIISGGNIE